MNLDLQFLYVCFYKEIYQQICGLPQVRVTSPLYKYGVRFLWYYVDDFLFDMPIDQVNKVRAYLERLKDLYFSIEISILPGCAVKKISI